MAATESSAPSDTVPIAEVAKQLARDLRPTNAGAEAILGNLIAQLKNDSETPVLAEYVRQSPLCAELFNLWEAQAQSTTGSSKVKYLIVEVLAFVLESRFGGDVPLAKARFAVAARIMNDFLRQSYRFLESERDHLLRVTLRMLGGIVAQSPALAHQFVRNFNWQHESFVNLVYRRSGTTMKQGGREKPQEEANPKLGRVVAESVRNFYIKFALNFLKWKDPVLTDATLRVKGFVAPIFAGLKDDVPQDAVFFLNAVQDMIVAHRDVPRLSKLFLFNGNTLRRLCGLLATGESEVASAARRMLSDMCTNTFIYREQQRNLLLDMCLELRPLRRQQQDLIISVLRAHPGVHHAFLSKYVTTVQPQLNKVWLESIGFLLRLVDIDLSCLYADISKPGVVQDAGAKELRLIGFLHVFVPKALHKTLMSQALIHKDRRVLWAVLLLLLNLMRRMKKIYAANVLEQDILDELTQRIVNSIPHFGTLLNLWQKLLQKPQNGESRQVPSPPKKKRRKDAVNEDEDEPQEVDEENVQAEDLTNDEIREYLGVDQHYHDETLFSLWCEAVQAYLQVFPLNALDVKFDWSKMLTVVVNPLLECKENPVEKRARDYILPCIKCVEEAIFSGGQCQGMQMSKSRLSWVELLFRSLGAATEDRLADQANPVRTACEDALHRSFEDLGIFGKDGAAEICVWSRVLSDRPEGLSFFIEVLRIATTKPGAFAGSAMQRAGSKNTGLNEPAAQGSCSLFFVAAVRELAKRDPSKAKSATEVELFSCVAQRLATVLPHLAGSMVAELDASNTWGFRQGDVAADSGSQSLETVRQTLISRLSELIPGKPQHEDSEPSRAKKRKSNKDGSVAGVGAALRFIVENFTENSVDDAENVIKAARGPVAAIVKARRPHAHCAAYVLLEGARASLHQAENVRYATWCLLLLIELIPTIALPRSNVLDHALSHSLWPVLVALASRHGQETRDGDAHVLLLVAVAFLAELLLECSKDTRRTSQLRSTCLTWVVPLWGALGIEAKIPKSMRKHMADASGGRLAEWVQRPLQTSATAVVTLCTRFNLLETFLRDHLPKMEEGYYASTLGALLCPDVERESMSKEPAYLRVSVSLRTKLLGALARAVGKQGTTDYDESNCEFDIAEKALRNALAYDREGFLGLALAGTESIAWVDDKNKKTPISPGLVPLLKQICWVNPTIRQKVVKKLSWKVGPPRSVLDLAICLAPLEPSLPFLNHDSLGFVTPESLRPLPSESQLCQLLKLHSAPKLLELIREASLIADDSRIFESSVILEDPSLGFQQNLEYGLSACRSFSSHASAAGESGCSARKSSVSCAAKVGQMLSRSTETLDKPVRKLLCQGVEFLLENAPESAATLLSGLLEAGKNSTQPSWACDLAMRVIECSKADEQSVWYLSHLALWSVHLKEREAIFPVLGKVNVDYNCSTSVQDCLRRQVLVAFAAGDASVASDISNSKEANTTVWSFREWCGSLHHWGGGHAWNWTLHPLRVKATVDRPCFGRLMADRAPWLHKTSCADGVDNVAQRVSDTGKGGTRASIRVNKIDNAETYDLAYVLAFLAGQLRSIWVEHGGAEDARGVLGPVLTSICTGGPLELLLLGLACEDDSIRACANEGLAVVMAIADLWKIEHTIDDEVKNSIKRRSRCPFKELPEVVRLLVYTRSTIEPPKKEGGLPRPLPRILTCFVSACLPILLEPAKFSYFEIGKEICKTAKADVTDVPGFYRLFLSGHAESHEVRMWMFNVLRRAIVGVAHGEVHFSVKAGIAVTEDEFRSAMQRRYLIEWLLSFASSTELGSFQLWREAVACLRSVLVDHTVSSPVVLGVAEWVSSQAVRVWPGTHSHTHHVQALNSLTFLLGAVLRASSRRKAPAQNIRCLGEALNSLLSAWRLVVEQDSPTFSAPIADLWNAIHELARLACQGQDAVGVAAKASSAEGFHLELSLAEEAAYAAQISVAVDKLSSLSAGKALASSLHSKGISVEDLVAQGVALAKTSPESVAIHLVLRNFLRMALKPAPVVDGRVQSKEMHELGESVEWDVVAFLNRVRMVAKSFKESAARHNVLDVVLALASLPFRLSVGWRVHALACVIVFEVSDNALLELSRNSTLQDLASQMPSPTCAVSVSLGIDFTDNVDSWRSACAQMLGQLVQLAPVLPDDSTECLLPELAPVLPDDSTE